MKRVKPGQMIWGPAIVRRRYMRGWEYSLLYENGTYTPFGALCPRSVKWVYQITWTDIVQKLVRVQSDQYVSAESEPLCWWMKPGTMNASSRAIAQAAFKIHSAPL